VAVPCDFIADGSGCADASVDYVMLFNILHDERPKRILREAYRILTPGGRVGIIHWKYDSSTPRGPPMEIRPKPEKIYKRALGCRIHLPERARPQALSLWVCLFKA